MQATNEVWRRPHSHQQNVSAMAGFVSSLLSVSLFTFVTWDRAQLDGLNISLRSIVKASYARHCRNTNEIQTVHVAVIFDTRYNPEKLNV